MYDAIIVGARCAGSATAMLLARSGYSVLLVDKAGFPSDTLSTHYIHQPGVAKLAKWGLLEKVAATGCPPIETQIFDVGPFQLVGSPPPADGITTGYAPRRTVLDAILVDAAVAAGAELREHFMVKELLSEGDHVTGIRGRVEGGPLTDERARVVIGADGMRSSIARLVKAPKYTEAPLASCAYYTYFSDVEGVDTVELYPRPNRMLIAAPTNHGLTLTIGYWPQREFDEVRSDVDAHFMKAMEIVPSLAERLHAGTRVEKIRGSGDLQSFFRKPFGPGWALVGDAGYHKNPITAEGITGAFRDADLLASALDDVFAERVKFDDALATYEQSRNEAAGPIYGMTCDLAKLDPPTEEMQKIMFALQGNDEQIGRFFGTLAGTTPIPEFFSPENLGKIFAAA